MTDKKDKIRILEAYFGQSHPKVELKNLLTHGLAYTDVPWIFDN